MLRVFLRSKFMDDKFSSNLINISIINSLLYIYIYLLIINHFLYHNTNTIWTIYWKRKKSYFSVMLQAKRSTLVTKDVSNKISKCKNEISF